MKSDNTILKEIELLNPWHQILYFDETIVSPGKWNPQKQFMTLAKYLNIKDEITVLDCGANAGGIGFEFAKNGANVTNIEINAQYIKQQELFKKYKQKNGELFINKVKICKDNVFNAHTYGDFDIVLALGLVYHFRYPQLFLDYFSNLNAKIFIFSSQTIGENDMIMRNRCLKYNKNKLMGYEPTATLFKKMLELSGFEIKNSFHTNDLEFTNNFYCICTKKESTCTNPELISKICIQSLVWS